MELPAAPSPGMMHKQGSSNQLFVLLEEDEELPRQTPRESPTSGSEQPTPRRPGLVRQDAWRCGATMLVAAGVAALVSCIVLLVGGRGMGQQSSTALSQPASEQLPAPQQKSMLIGTARLPGDLPPAPKSKVVMMGHPAYHCSYGMSPRCPARELFTSAELHEVATENLMQVGHGILVHKDRDLVRATVAAGFKNLTRQLDQHAPEVAHELARIELTVSQKNAVLTLMRLMSVPEVQRIGFEVALAIRRSVSLEKDVIKRHIEEMLANNIEEIRETRDDTVPDSVLALWGSGHAWEMTLEPENVKVMEAFRGGEFFGSMNASFYAESLPKTPERMPAQEKAYAVWGGVLEHGRALLDTVKLISWSSGVELRPPAWVTSLGDNIDVKDLGSELLSCELHKKSGMNNLMKAFFCPLKYGTQGMDALRAAGQLKAS